MVNDARIEIKSATALSAEEVALVDALASEVFGNDEDGYVWSDVDWHVLVWGGSTLVSHVEVIERVGTVAGQPVRLGGIGGVGTLPGWRRQGYATAAMQAAAVLICDRLGVDFGLLICSAEKIPFYRSVGWVVAKGPLTFDQPGGIITFDDVTMVLPCKDQSWPEGVIDLCGLPW